MLYKYRGFYNFEFALDIFVNKRLYAANYKKLNDPMEGRFIYGENLSERVNINEIVGDKARYKILSLSETPNNMLMWSYYSEAHAGFVVGVEITQTKAIKRTVRYVEDLRIDNVRQQNLALYILSRKLKLWIHERERRVFIKNPGRETFVSVEPRELIFGINANGPKKELLASIAERFCPSIDIRQINRDDLETGHMDAYGI
ncbi:MAG: hypothetical protein WBC05_07500 [Sedimentisphaerales bacterium]